MDFTKHDARTASETPIEVKLRHQATGEPIMDGDNYCSVMVMGAGARSVQADIMAEARSKMTVAGSKKKDQAKAIEDAQKAINEGAARVIRGFKHIERDGTPLTTSKEDIAWFLDLTFISMKELMKEDDDEEKWRGASFAQQILSAAHDVGLYLGE